MTISKWYGLGFISAFNGLIDISSDTLKVALCTSSYSPNQDTHQFFSSVTNQVSGTGYTAGGAVLGTPSVIYTGSSNTFKLTGANVVWSDSTITARYAVIYDASPATDAERPLIAYIDFESNASSSNGLFQITWDAAGIATVTVN